MSSLLSEPEVVKQLLEEKDYSTDTILMAVQSLENMDVLKQYLKKQDNTIKKQEQRYCKLYKAVRKTIDKLNEVGDFFYYE